jgi:hypothetical protein
MLHTPAEDVGVVDIGDIPPIVALSLKYHWPASNFYNGK